LFFLYSPFFYTFSVSLKNNQMIKVIKGKGGHVLAGLFSALLLLSHGSAYAQISVNYEEAAVGDLKLPDILVTDKGSRVSSRKGWEAVRRGEILRKFEQHVYGRIPRKPRNMKFEITEKDPGAFNGLATRIQSRIVFDGSHASVLNVLMYLPNDREKVPVFTGLNFNGNHSLSDDSAVFVSDHYKRLHPRDTAFQRGKSSGRWPVQEILSNGFGIATAYYEELEPDQKDGYKSGVRTRLAKNLGIDPGEWGALAVWGWGLSRIVDFLETLPQVDHRRIALIGHSRLGKAALWAAANDTRFSLVISNNSGEGGAALSKRNFGETIEHITTMFPHWFVDTYRTYSKAPEKLPVDQHMLLSLIAPRPLYVASASEDQWADPRGEFLAARHAGVVYALYEKRGIEAESPPEPDQSVGDVVAYHIRTGKHDVTPLDWREYILFAIKHFR
jgi:hypothetical protein